MTRNKYIALFQITKSGNKVAKIVDLGKAANPNQLVITENTYAFKVFTSLLDLKGVSYNFFNSEENYNSVFAYIGKEMNIYDYADEHPNDPQLVLLEGSKDSFVAIIANTYDESAVTVSLQSKFGHYRVVTKEHLNDLGFEVVTAKELVNNYNYNCIL